MSDEEDDSGSNMIHSSNLKKFLRSIDEKEDTQVGSDASDYMEVQIENICREVWKQAERNTVERDNKRVQEADVRAAFDEVFYPYALLEDSIAKLGEYQLELERATDEYPILEFDEPETEEEGNEGSINDNNNIYFCRDGYEPQELLDRLRVRHYRATDHSAVSSLLSDTDITEEDLEKGKKDFLTILKAKVEKDRYEEFLQNLFDDFGEKGDRVNIQYFKSSKLSYDKLKEEVANRERAENPRKLFGEPLENKVVEYDTDSDKQIIDIRFYLQESEATYEVQDISNFDLSDIALPPDESLVFRKEYNAEVRAYIEEGFIAISNSQISDSVQNRIRKLVIDWAEGSHDPTFEIGEIELLVLQNLMNGDNCGLDFGEFRDEKLNTAKYRGDRRQALSRSPVLTPAQDGGRITQVRFYYDYTGDRLGSSRSVQTRIYSDGHITTSKPVQPDFADDFTELLERVLKYPLYWKSLNYRIRQFLDRKLEDSVYGGERSYLSSTNQAFGRLVDKFITKDDYEPVERQAYKAAIASVGIQLIQCNLSDSKYPSVGEAASRPDEEHDLKKFFNDVCEFDLGRPHPDFDELWDHMYYALHRPHESPIDVVEATVEEYDL